MDIRFVDNEKNIAKNLGSPRYVNHRIYTEDLIGVFLSKRAIKMNKGNLHYTNIFWFFNHFYFFLRGFAVGFTILEFSKAHMFRSYYQSIKPMFGEDNVSLLLTDTDSIIMNVRNFTRREIFERLSPIMDYSNLPIDHEFYDDSRKQVPGYFKVKK